MWRKDQLREISIFHSDDWMEMFVLLLYHRRHHHWEIHLHRMIDEMIEEIVEQMFREMFEELMAVFWTFSFILVYQTIFQ